jgi:hypothetical protein
VYDLPAYVWLVVLAAVVGIPAATCLALYRGALEARLGGGAAARVAGGAAVLLGGWLVTSAVLADHRVYHQEPGQTRPWLGVAVGGLLLALLAGTRIPPVARALAAPGTAARLAAPHTWRLGGGAFLLVMALGHLPALFALPAGLGDIAIGLAAVPVARRLARGTLARRPAFWFNVLGILDLVVAVGIGTSIGYHLLTTTPDAEPLSLLPLTLIPTTAVPLLVALHITSLRHLPAAAAAHLRPVPTPGPVHHPG